MTIFNRTLFIFLALLLAGCSSGQKQIALKESDATEKFIDPSFGKNGVGTLYALDNGISLRTSEFLAPVVDFKQNRKCDLSYLWTLPRNLEKIDKGLNYVINGKGAYTRHSEISGNPDYIIEFPKFYRFASDIDMAIAVLLSYAVDLSNIRFYISDIDLKSEPWMKEDLDTYKRYIRQLVTQLNSFCEYQMEQTKFRPDRARKVKLQLLDESYRYSFVKFVESINSYAHNKNWLQMEPEDVIYCEEKKTSLKDFSLIKCYDS